MKKLAESNSAGALLAFYEDNGGGLHLATPDAIYSDLEHLDAGSGLVVLLAAAMGLLDADGLTTNDPRLVAFDLPAGADPLLGAVALVAESEVEDVAEPQSPIMSADSNALRRRSCVGSRLQCQPQDGKGNHYVYPGEQCPPRRQARQRQPLHTDR